MDLKTVRIQEWIALLSALDKMLAARAGSDERNVQTEQCVAGEKNIKNRSGITIL